MKFVVGMFFLHLQCYLIFNYNCPHMQTCENCLSSFSAVIAPPNELIVPKGDNITVTCTLLDLNLSSFTAEDILWTKDSVSLSSHLSHVLSLNTSRLTVVNSTFVDSGNYGCGLPGDTYNDLEQLAVTVAGK